MKPVAVSFLLRRQTDGYSTLPGHRASVSLVRYPTWTVQEQKNLNCSPHPASTSIKVGLCSFLLRSSGIPPERKKPKAAIMSARACYLARHGTVRRIPHFRPKIAALRHSYGAPLSHSLSCIACAGWPGIPPAVRRISRHDFQKLKMWPVTTR